MYETAKDYYRAKKRLESSAQSFGFSGTLLSILSFEVLLKAVRLVETNDTGRDRHNCYKIWKALPEPTQEALLRYASDRYSHHTDYSDLKDLLKNWEELFAKGRYEYEKHRGRTQKEVRLSGEAWIEAGAKVSEADFKYYPIELDGLTLACSNFLRKRFGLELHDFEV
jgi:hypothetical protein